MFIFLCYNCYNPDYEIQKKTHMHVWKCKQQEFLVFPLRPAHVLTDDYVFLIMENFSCNKDVSNNESILLAEQ